MGPVHIRHHFATPSPVILWIELGRKPKWLPLNFGYHDIMCTASTGSNETNQHGFALGTIAVRLFVLSQ